MIKILAALLLSLLWLIDPASLHSQADQPRGSFAKAYKLFTQGRLHEAEVFFQGALAQETVLQDYTLYFLGAISFSREVYDGASDYFLRIKKEFPRSVWLNEANLHLAKISINNGDNEQAIELLSLLGARGVKKGIFTESLYLLGQTYGTEGEFKQAHAAFQRLRNSYPFSSWARMAKREVLRIKKHFAAPLGLNEPRSLLEEGKILLKEGETKGAENLFRRLSTIVSGKSLYLPSLKGLIMVYRSARRRDKEISALRKLVEKFPQRPEASEAFYRIAELFWNQGNNTRALTEFKRFQKRYPQSKLVDKSDIAIGRIYESLRRRTEAMGVFSDFPKRFPRSRFRWEATWRLAWMHYLSADYDRALSTFEGIASDDAPDHFRYGSLYWQARSAERMGNSEDAKGLYSEILRTASESYYRGPAVEALRRLGEEIVRNKPPKEPSPSEPKVPFNRDLSFHLSHAQRLADLSLHRLAVVELDEVRDHIGKDPALRLMLMRQYVRNQGFNRSIGMAIRLNLQSQEFKRFRYPLAYWKTIRKEAVKRGIDPYLILALIRQESLFYPDAISPASALGLMQLLPSTAGREAASIGLSLSGPENLFDPDLNLTLGIHHLKRLFDLYPKSVAKVLAAYNAGRRPVNRWKKRLASMDEEEFIERIPYRETRFYVKLVLRNYWMYRELYDGH